MSARVPASRTGLHITINGESRVVAAGSTVASLLQELGLASQPVAVERNKTLVRRHEHAATAIADGDRLEVVTFLGGG